MALLLTGQLNFKQKKKMFLLQLSDSGFKRTGTIQTAPATFLTAQSISCPVTGSLPLTVLLLSVSNDGVNKSNEAIYIIQDPVCYDCNTITEQCSLQVNMSSSSMKTNF